MPKKGYVLRRHAGGKSLGQGIGHLAADLAKLAQRGFQGRLLPFEFFQARIHELFQAVQLLRLIRIGIVEFQVLAHLCQTEAETFGPQDELKTAPITLAINPAGTDAARRQQPFGFVKAQRARGDSVGFGQFRGRE